MVGRSSLPARIMPDNSLKLIRWVNRGKSAHGPRSLAVAYPAAVLLDGVFPCAFDGDDVLAEFLRVTLVVGVGIAVDGLWL